MNLQAPLNKNLVQRYLLSQLDNSSVLSFSEYNPYTHYAQLRYTFFLPNIIHDEHTILKFIGNCALKNRGEIRNIHRMLFIFKKDGEIYIDYETIYRLKREKNIYKLEIIKDNEKDFNSDGIELDETILKTIPSSSKLYTIIKLSDLATGKKYDNKCFCYLVVTEKILTQFYRWWC